MYSAQGMAIDGVLKELLKKRINVTWEYINEGTTWQIKDNVHIID